MFFNVVDAYAYTNYTDVITWPFIRLNNACQCLDARIKHLFSIKIPLVNMEHNNNNNNLLARVIQQYNDQYKKHSNSITVPNGVVAIC